MPITKIIVSKVKIPSAAPLEAHSCGDGTGTTEHQDPVSSEEGGKDAHLLRLELPVDTSENAMLTSFAYLRT